MTPKIVIGGRDFFLVKIRAYSPIAIYKNDNSFLRIGPKDLILPELNFHKNLLELGFQVPKIISEGERDGQYYYLETSLGDRHLGDLFRENYEKSGAVSEENFKKLLSLIVQFTKAQLNTAKIKNSFESLYLGAHVDYIQEELPNLKERVLAAFEKLKKRIGDLPSVLTHGDLNAYNLFERGVIDFGNSFESPAGYDLVTVVYHAYLFPKKGDFESLRKYEFSRKQIENCLVVMDSIYLQNNLPKLSAFTTDFIFLRTIWSAVRMHKYPKVQRWRYNKFKQVLENYLSDGDVVNIILGD